MTGAELPRRGFNDGGITLRKKRGNAAGTRSGGKASTAMTELDRLNHHPDLAGSETAAPWNLAGTV
jgi:hypothetical protein